MGLVTIYDTNGVEYQKEMVDARECVKELGFTYEKVEVKPVEVVQEAKAAETIAPIESKVRKVKDVIIEDKV